MASTTIRHAPVALAVLALCAQAQTDAPAEGALPTVVIKARTLPSPTELSGFGNVPLARSPLQATVIDEEQMQAQGVQRLADIVKFDASISDSYNSEGYWDFLSVRGFTLDNRFNYRRDGLPINAETRIPLDNKAGIEVLRGTSGIQAGTSAPGGLVNYVVKRPTSEPVRSVQLGLREDSSRLVADGSRRRGRAMKAASGTASMRPTNTLIRARRACAAIATWWLPPATGNSPATP